MRERLIELIEKASKEEAFDALFSSIDDVIDMPRDKEYLADYLITNGVIVPPCKVGDAVYVIEPCTCYNNYEDKCKHRRTKATKWIAIVKVPKKHHKKCLKLFERPFKIEYFNKLGKTVFPTREEAEKALKEREGI